MSLLLLLRPQSAGGSGNTIAVPAGALTLTGYAPTVTGVTTTISVPAGSLTLTGFAPTVTVSDNKTIAVPAGSLSLTGFAPTVIASSANIISIPAGALVLTGFAPTVSVTTTTLRGRNKKKLRWREWKLDVPTEPDVRITPEGELVRRIVEAPKPQIAALDLAPYFDKYDAVTRRMLKRIQDEEDEVIAIVLLLDD